MQVLVGHTKDLMAELMAKQAQSHNPQSHGMRRDDRRRCESREERDSDRFFFHHENPVAN
jgi:hypothetical protein